MRRGQSAKRDAEPPKALVCDFDGTITNLDTGELVLDRLADGDWRYHHEQYVRGAITFEECLRRQFALRQPTTKASILALVDEYVKVRPGFEGLLASAELVAAPVAVASYGLDFCIRHVLGRVRNGREIRVYSPRATVGANGVRLAFPRRRLKESTNLKDDVVGLYKQRGFRVIFVGDGASDFPAVGRADESFAIAGSELAKMCKEAKIQCSSITEFSPIADALAR